MSIGNTNYILEKEKQISNAIDNVLLIVLFCLNLTACAFRSYGAALESFRKENDELFIIGVRQIS